MSARAPTEVSRRSPTGGRAGSLTAETSRKWEERELEAHIAVAKALAAWDRIDDHDAVGLRSVRQLTHSVDFLRSPQGFTTRLWV